MLELVPTPLLRLQRDLYALPRDMARFRRYLELLQADSPDVIVPLSALNPMGREHVAERLDALLAFDADAVLAETTAEAARALDGPDLHARLRVSAVIIDDAHGGWTNRSFVEINLRFTPHVSLDRGWLTVPAWSSETPEPAAWRREVLATVYRAVWILRHGEPRTLRARLELSGRAAAFAGHPLPPFDQEELDYTRAVLAPLLDAEDVPTHLAALYGDAAARAVGMTPLGLSAGAAYAVAQADASHHPTATVVT